MLPPILQQVQIKFYFYKLVLNLDVPFLEGKVTTTENVVIDFWKILDKKLRLLNDVNCQLHCIKLYETPRNFVEYYGEK